MTQDERYGIFCDVESEGFDYTFVHYNDYSGIKDSSFHILRKNYLLARKSLEEYLKLEEFGYEG